MIDQCTANRFFESSGIPILLIDDNSIAQLAAPTIATEMFPHDLLQNLLEKRREKMGDSFNPLVAAVDPGLYFGIAKIAPSLYLFVGPVAGIPLDASELMEFAKKILKTSDGKVVNILTHTPVRFYRRFITTFICGIQMFTGQSLNTEDVIVLNVENSDIAAIVEAQIADILLDDNHRESSSFHTPLEWEQETLISVENGNRNGVENSIASPVYGQMGKLSNDPLTNARYLFVASATLLTRAAIRGGLPDEDARNISDAYCMQMEDLHNSGDIYMLACKLAYDFCDRVAARNQNVGSSLSRPVQLATEYIDKHINERIDMTTLSKATHFSARTISRKFREEIGLSVADYLHREKMRKAQHLLRNSSLSILEISNFLQYSAQSYFTKIFKETFGVTPKQYHDGVPVKKDL